MGSPIFSSKAPLLFGFSALAFLVVGIGGWSALAQIDGAIIAPGVVEVAGRRQVVQHLQGGIIAEILARDGDAVEADQVLLRFDGSKLHPELAIVDGQLLELLARRDRLAAERDSLEEIKFSPELVALSEERTDVAALMAGQAQQFMAGQNAVMNEVRALNERRTQVERQVDGLEAQREATQIQIGLREQELTSIQTLLNKGLARQPDVLAQERDLAQLRGIMGQIASSAAESAARIAEIEVEILRLGSERRKMAVAEMRDLEFREIELRETKTRLLADIGRLEVRAPAGGVVYGSRVDTIGSVMGPAEVLMSVVPQSAGIVIQAMIEPMHVDEVHPGQDVVLRFSTFNSRTTPEVSGSIASVSPDAFTDERTGISHYRAEVHLDVAATQALGGKELLPGMPVETFIKTGERTPLGYLVRPLMDYFSKALRET